MSTNHSPAHFTHAELATAKGYLIACAEQSAYWEPEHSEEIEALSGRENIDRALRLWPQGWADFCSYFAADIADAEQAQIARWNAEAAHAARGHLFASRLPAAVRRWGHCTLTARAAVWQLGVDLADIPVRDTEQWRYSAEVLEVPLPVVIAWAIEGRARQRLIRLADPLRRAPSTSV
ncbi:hypothetical protein [Nocardia brasiliensis]|uniref:hypothetical protein n=1 Tax=Nocardia brasiliensis TaxID=37326 RepID=UPI002458ECB5|nr:hypothetical protein [Nocardia brasiliensis]